MNPSIKPKAVFESTEPHVVDNWEKVPHSEVMVSPHHLVRGGTWFHSPSFFAATMLWFKKKLWGSQATISVLSQSSSFPFACPSCELSKWVSRPGLNTFCLQSVIG